MDDNKKLIQQFYVDVFSYLNEQVAYQILAETFKVHALPPLQPIIGIETFLQRVKSFHQAFSQIEYVVNDQIAEGDKVATRFTATGHHQGLFLEVPGSGKHVSWSGIAIHRIDNGKIIENWINADFLGLKNQLLDENST